MDPDFDTTTQEYVEIIYDLQKINKVARVKDIAKKRGVTRSSVSTALTFLKKKKLVNHETYGLVELTDSGNKLGEELEKRHEIIKDFFLNILNIDHNIAEENACIVEHYIDKKVLDSLVNFIDFIKNKPEWLSQFKNSPGNYTR